MFICSSNPKTYYFHTQVQFKAGHLNKAANALSRQNEYDNQLYAITQPQLLLLDELRAKILNSVELWELQQRVDRGKLDDSWTVHNGILFFKGTIFLQSTSPLIASILSGFHDDMHEGYQKTLQRVQSEFYWQGMHSTIANYVASCQYIWTLATS